MTHFARVSKSGIVRQVVVGEPNDGNEWIEIGPENTVGIGWIYQDGEFISPYQNEENDDETPSDNDNPA